MGIKYLWDTNTAIYYLQQQFPPTAEKFIDETLLDSSSAISVITEIELLCWKTDSEKDLIVLRDFIHDTEVFELEKAIKLKTAEIRKAHKIKLPDAIIAATALAHDFTLLTRNIKDFKHIEGLSLINPYARLLEGTFEVPSNSPTGYQSPKLLASSLLGNEPCRKLA